MRRRIRADGRIQVEVAPGKWVLKPTPVYKPVHKAILEPVEPDPAEEEE